MTAGPEARIAAAAWQLFGRGIARVGVPEVAQLAGMSRGGLQVYYRHKDDLVRLVVDRALAEAGDRASPRVAEQWARVWVALRTESLSDEGLRRRLSVLHADAVHPTRLAALAKLLFPDDAIHLFAQPQEARP